MANHEAELKAEIVRFIDDPVGFVKFVFPWGKGRLEGQEGPDAWQEEVLGILAGYSARKFGGVKDLEPLQLAIASGHGIGKTALVAWIIHWFMSTREFPQVVVTANTENQLQNKTWRELAKWQGLAINGHWFEHTATKYYLKAHEKDWFASAIPWSENNSDAFAGTHEDNVLMLFDEASKISDSIWSVVDGAMSTRGAMWLAFGNPWRNTGRFAECFSKYKKWWVTKNIDARTAKMAQKSWVDRMIEMFGIDSDKVRTQVLGLFPAAATNQLISSAAVDRAMGHEVEVWEFAPKIVGVDIARFGDNQSEIAVRQGRKVREIVRIPKGDLMMQAQFIADFLRKERPSMTCVDGAGMGAGVVDRLRQLGFQVMDVNGGNSSINPRFLNKRAEMWWEMKEWIEVGECELPKDSDLKDQLCCVEYDYTDKGRIRLERKEDIVEKYDFSPDKADALSMTFAYPVADFSDEQDVDPKVYEDS